MSEKIRIFIATTEGPAEVQRLAEEDPAVQSVICLQGRAIALPVSSGYDAFVRRPTGIIEAAFGHPAYRLDLAQPVTGGSSWQLGVLLAHGLHAEGRLAERGEEAVRALWATGEVDRELAVLPVDHLAEKIRSSAGLFHELLRKGVPLSLCLPRENRRDLESIWAATTELSSDCVDIVDVEHAPGLFAHIGLPAPRARQANAKEGKRPLSRVRVLGLSAILLAGFAGLSYGFTVLTTAEVPASTVIKPAVGAQAPITLTALETRAPGGASCAAVALGAAPPLQREVPLTSGGRRASVAVDALCRLRYRATNRGQRRDLWLVGARAGAGAEELHAKTFLSALRLAPDESESFEVVLPRHFDDVLVQRFALVARPAAEGTSGAFDHTIEISGAKLTPAAWRAWVSRLRAKGFTVEVAEHALVP